MHVARVPAFRFTPEIIPKILNWYCPQHPAVGTVAASIKI